MEKDKKYKQNCEVCSQIIEVDDYKQGEFPVCNCAIFVDSNGNGNECPNCSWAKNALSKEYPDRVICSNLISLNKAIRLYKECKPFTLDYDDFIDGYNFYGEMEFTYQAKHIWSNGSNEYESRVL